MSYRGHVRNGVVVLDESVELDEGAEVCVEVLQLEEKKQPLGKQLLRFAGVAKGLPSDLARNHDYYLHGLPKK